MFAEKSAKIYRVPHELVSSDGTVSIKAK